MKNADVPANLEHVLGIYSSYKCRLGGPYAQYEDATLRNMLRHFNRSEY